MKLRSENVEECLVDSFLVLLLFIILNIQINEAV